MIKFILKIIKWILIIIFVGGAGVVVGWFAHQGYQKNLQIENKNKDHSKIQKQNIISKPNK